MESATIQQELSIVLPALIVSKMLETGEYPDIVEVRAVSPELADNMKDLGYDELTDDLLQAFLRVGDVKELGTEEVVRFHGSAVEAFVGD